MQEGGIGVAKFSLEVIAVQKMPVELIHEAISKEKKPPIKLERFEKGEYIPIEVPQEIIGGISDFEEDKSKIFREGSEEYIVVKGSAQDIMEKICKVNNKHFKNRVLEVQGERVQVQIPEYLIGSLSPTTVQTLDGKLEEATKLFQKETDKYIIISGSVIDNLKKLCPTLDFSQFEG